ncbi:MAG: hypothetical protein ACI81P_002534 [Neolewinella sp.]
MKTITLKINNTGAWYAEGGVVPWSSTNLPADDFSFQEREIIYWEAEMLGYDEVTQMLKVRITDFEAEPNTFQPYRKMKRPVIALRFAPLNAEAFKTQLSSYKIDRLRKVFIPGSPPPASPPELRGTPPVERVLPRRSVSFNHPILGLTFGNGHVASKAELPGLLHPIPFSIPNDHLVAEFESIKPFFVKALKRQTIKVTGYLIFENDVALLKDAASPQIERINSNMLEIFRARAVKSLLSPDKIKVIDKSLFTPEDVFDSLDDNELGKATLPHDGHDLLAEILRLQKVRNAKQLEFLAGRLHQPETKLRFVLSPHFGFVFLAIGREANHFILELLNSHATYIWSIPKFWKSLEDQYRSVENEIITITQLGRGQYRRTLHFEHEFWYIVHEAAESGVVDGFPRWKNRLLEGMV